MRTEQEVFDELAALCARSGYAHAITFFCFRDTWIAYRDQLTGADYAKNFSSNRLIRTEISTLIGLMARNHLDFSFTSSQEVQAFTDRSEALLQELHLTLMQPFVIDVSAGPVGSDVDPIETAEAMREPIFYGAESAYSSQYRDLAPQKYKRDETWLREAKGFSMDEATVAARAIMEFLNKKSMASLLALKNVPMASWSILGAFQFSTSDIVGRSRLPPEIVRAFLAAFTFVGDGNPTFTSLNEFNAVNAYPLLKMDDDHYVLFQYVSLTEALYETPFYWMSDCKAYKESAMINRGRFTEEFAAERLEQVFGADRVYRNVDIWESKAKKLGEIDVLVLFADRAIVVQAKSKKLTLAARKGNDLQLRGDFKRAVQDAYDQAYMCSRHLLSNSLIFTDASGKPVHIPKPLKQVHPVCVVSDHYPALSFQARQFLKYDVTDVITAPLVCDVFLIDTVTELLRTPLRFLSYLELRAMAGDKLIFSHETLALAFHLKQNLHRNLGKYDLIHLDDNISSDLDVAMAVRREGVDGEATPPGILTQLQGLSVGLLIEQIERSSEMAAVGLGLELLKLSETTARDLSQAIDNIASKAYTEMSDQGFSLAFGDTGMGLTVHCNRLPYSLAAQSLQQRCHLRKYDRHASKWFGISIQPGSGTLRFGIMLNYPWQADANVEKAVKDLPTAVLVRSFRKLASTRSGKIKVGRNEPCPCGSGQKYKKCCLAKP
jgi:hypothetical protein